MSEIYQPIVRQVDAMRYVVPLREGGSMPALMDASDGYQYVLKFLGAGQGVKALIAEFIGGEIAKALDFRIPEIVFVDVDPAFGRSEPDPEIQDLLKASTGLNLGIHFLKGAMNFDPLGSRISSKEASALVWLDAFLMNVDRTTLNTNLLVWKNEIWLIDHGAALYFHHNLDNWQAQAIKPFVNIKDHVVLKRAGEIEEADKRFSQILSDETIQNIIAAIPECWLQWGIADGYDAAGLRQIYADFLITRKNNSSIFVKQAIYARQSLL